MKNREPYLWYDIAQNCFSENKKFNLFLISNDSLKPFEEKTIFLSYCRNVSRWILTKSALTVKYLY